MLQPNAAPAAVMLGSDDLELLQRFLRAWCDENDVDIRNEAAADIASALIHWYLFDLADRNRLKLGPRDAMPESQHLQHLLRQLGEA
ncbi:hypothetical protein [Rhizobium terrae]|uniref:hypothetical protein n=1 Tax=Rhizobium terrae TaxID=2171756 RepID=UPI000E3D6EDF|nr:hypothetical protein [Rhizobium terrae]